MQFFRVRVPLWRQRACRSALSVCALSLALAAGADDGAPSSQPAMVDVAATSLPEVIVSKNPTCGCCGEWISHLERYGFAVSARNVENMNPIKERVGVPFGMGSCHTAEVGGYFIEGHVPAEEVKRLLAERPNAKGLTVPGMPIGSPGMEHGERIDPYKVYLVHEDGSTSVYAEYPKRAN
jgi:hypothetical protein